MSTYKDISRVKENLVDSEAIKASIENMLFVSKKELLFNREFGSRLEYYLFQPLSFAISRLIYMDIRSALSYDPRVKLLNTSSVTVDKVNRSYHINLKFSVKGLNTPVSLDKELKVKEKGST